MRHALLIGCILTTCAVASALAGGAYDLEIAAHATPAAVEQYVRVDVPLILENRGAQEWTPGSFNVSYHWRSADGSVVLWDGLRTPLTRSVAPGERAEVAAQLEAPRASGHLSLQWDVVHEGVTWVSQRDATPAPSLPVIVIARTPPHAFSRISGGTVRLMLAGQNRKVRALVRNDGTEPWGEAAQFRLSYHWASRDGTEGVFDGVRTRFPRPVAPGTSIEVDATVEAPRHAGLHTLRWDVVREGALWFSDQDPTPDTAVTVLVLPAGPPAPLAFLFALICLALAYAAVRMRFESRLVPGLASVADLALLAVALIAKQSAAIEAMDVGFTMDATALVVSGVAAIVLLVALVPRAVRPWVALAVNLLASVVILADLLHARFFGDFLSIVRLRAAGQLPELTTSIATLVQRSDLWLFADLAPALVLIPLLRRVTPPRDVRLIRLAAATAALLLIPGAIALLHLRGLGTERFSQVFKNAYLVQELGLLNYHAFDACAHLRTANPRKLPESRMQAIEMWLQANAPHRAGTGPHFGAARGRNLVMIQVESMQNFVLGLRIDGVEVTPNLNRMLATEALWFSGCTDQTAQGRTSDGELLSQTSLHPLREGSAAFRFGGNRYHAIASILASGGYATISAVPYEASFWNRLVTLPGYGYAKNLHVADFKPGPVVGWGLNDRDFLRQMVPRLAAQQRPFAALLITLSNHHPFESFPDQLKEMRLGDYEASPLANYLHSMHLFDRAIGNLVEGLRAEAILDDTLIAVWGDHAAGLTWEPALATLAGRAFREPDFYQVDEVPFILRLPSGQIRGERDLRCGAADFAPTLLALLGVDPAPLAFLGRNLLGDPGNQPVVRSYGTWFANGLIYCPGGAAFEDGRCYEEKSGERVELSRCRAAHALAREQLEISRDIVEHDLQLPLARRLRENQSAANLRQGRSIAPAYGEACTTSPAQSFDRGTGEQVGYGEHATEPRL